MANQDKRKRIKFLILVIVLVLIWFLGSFAQIKPGALEEYLNKFPLLLSAVIFVISYCIFTFFIWFSKDIFRLVSAILFGAYVSTLFVFIAEFFNAIILFGLSRFLGRDFVRQDIGKKYSWVNKKIEGAGFFWLLMFRLTPLVPFRFLDLAAGLSGISFKRYLVIVILGSPLRIFWLQYILAGVGKNLFSDPKALVNYLISNQAVFIFTFIYLILAIVVTFKIRKE